MNMTVFIAYDVEMATAEPPSFSPREFDGFTTYDIIFQEPYLLHLLRNEYAAQNSLFH